MKKKETWTEEYEHCGECPYTSDWFDTGKEGYRCDKVKRVRIIKDLWGEIPEFCPLEDSDNTGKIKGGKL